MPGRTGAAALLACALVLFAGLAAAAQGEDQTVPSEPVTVEVTGLAPLKGDTPLAEAHRRALLDAHRNALLQAHVLVRVESLVRNMSLNEERVATATMGYVRSLEILEAGPVPDAEPPVYRVRARVVVVPVRRDILGVTLDLNRVDPWAPVVRLNVRGKPDAEAPAGAAPAIAGGLRDCGVRVADADERCAALPVDVTVAAASDESGCSVTVDWTVVSPAVEQEGGEGAVGLSGSWTHAGTAEPDPDWWAALALRIAQHVMRIWATPRPVTISFTDADEAQAARLEAAFQAARGVHMQGDAAASAPCFELPLTANAEAWAQALLTRAGVDDAARLVEADFAHLAYALGAAASGSEPGEPLVFMAWGESVVEKPGDAESLAEARSAAATMAKANLLRHIKAALTPGAVGVGDLMFQSQEDVDLAPVMEEVQNLGPLFHQRVVVTFVMPEVTDAQAGPQIVKAIASLTLPADEIDDLEKYLQ